MTTPLAGGSTVDLRRALRPHATGVWVVSSAHGGVPVGFTAISVAAASVDPPMLTFTIGRSSSSLDVLTAELRFAVHLLSAGQADAARRFADDARARFADPTTWSWGDDGLPVLADTAARASGSVVWMTDAGDSLLVLGRVESATGTDREPLLHHDRQYIGLTRARPEGDHR